MANQTIAAYSLPERLAAFHTRNPVIELFVAIDNTQGAARAGLDRIAEFGFIEGEIDEPAPAH